MAYHFSLSTLIIVLQHVAKPYYGSTNVDRWGKSAGARKKIGASINYCKELGTTGSFRMNVKSNVFITGKWIEEHLQSWRICTNKLGGDDISLRHH